MPFHISVLPRHVTNIFGGTLLYTDNLMSESVGIHEAKSVLSNALWGNFLKGKFFSHLMNSGEFHSEPNHKSI